MQVLALNILSHLNELVHRHEHISSLESDEISSIIEKIDKKRRRVDGTTYFYIYVYIQLCEVIKTIRGSYPKERAVQNFLNVANKSNDINICYDDIKKEIRKEGFHRNQKQSISFVDFHPDKAFLDIEDYMYFITKSHMRSYLVCDSFGELYFMQKNEPPKKGEKTDTFEKATINADFWDSGTEEFIRRELVSEYKKISDIDTQKVYNFFVKVCNTFGFKHYHGVMERKENEQYV